MSRRLPPRLRTSAAALLAAFVLPAATGGSVPPPAASAQAAPDQAYRAAATWSSQAIPLPPDAFEAPRGVAIDPFDGRVFVVDSGNDRIQVFEPDGSFVRTIGGPGPSPAGLDDPAGVAISGGRVYVSDLGHDRVALFDIDGVYRDEWTGMAGPWGITAWVDGRVFVAENRASQIAVYRSDGTREATWGRFGGGDALNRPEGIALSVDGQLLVANTGNQRVLLFDERGVVADSTGDLGAGPRAVALGQRDELYIATDDGQLRRHVVGLGLPAQGPARSLIGGVGLAVGPAGRLFATFQDDGRPLHGVRVWQGSTVVDEWGEVPLPLGRIDRPQRVWADATGRVTPTLVLDRWRRAQAFDPSGEPRWQVAVGAANEVLLLGDRDVVSVSDGQARRLDPTGMPRWTLDLPSTVTEAPWAVAAALDEAAQTAAVLDLGRQRLHRVDLVDGSVVDAPSFRPGRGATTALWDLSFGSGGDLWVVNRSAATVERRDPLRLRVLDAWAVPGDPLRIATGAAGELYVLNRHGWVWKFDPDGQLRAVWHGGDPADAASAPSDLSVDDAGRVLVSDAGLDRVRVFELDPDGTPGPVPEFEPSCSAEGDKRAAPSRIVLGQTVDVTLEVQGDCPRIRSEADIVLVVDISGSMAGEKLEAAKAAAAAFVDTIDFVDMHVSLVAFNQAAVLEQPLTANPNNVELAIERLMAGGGTDIAVALDAARRELTGPRRRPSANSVIVLLSDGGSAAPPAQRASELARLEGARIFTIGFGMGANGVLLEQLASSPSDYAFAPDEAELVAIYRRIAERIVANVLFTSLVVVDEIPTDMRYVEGSAAPAATFDGQRLVWQLSDVPFQGLRLRYQLEPQRTGIRPTNVIAAGDGVDGLGQAGRVEFPVPAVEVVAPTATPTPPPGITPSATPTATVTPSITPTPTITPTPGPIYLPLSRNDRCPKRRARVDVVLVLDMSTSMSLPTRAGRRKLDAAFEAAGAFLDLLVLDAQSAGGGDRAAIVAFDATARIAAPMSSSAHALRTALGGLEQHPGTRIDLGLKAARDVLAEGGDTTDRVDAVVLLTDGRPTGTTPAAVREAAKQLKAVHQEPPWVYAIGLGPDVDGALLGDVATDAARTILAPDGEDLQRIYREIARELPCVGGSSGRP